MNIYNTCVNPSSKFDSVIFLKQCFDNGHKLASLQSMDMFMTEKNIPKEWVLLNTHENAVLIFPNRFIAEMFKTICDTYRLLYDLNRYPSVRGDIIYGFFFGYCIFDIAQYAFLHENNNLNMTLDNAVQFLQEGTLTKEHLINIVKNGAFIRKEKDLKTVFNYILEISTYLYDQITLNPEYFYLNSTAVHNIQIGTLFYGSWA